MTAELPPAARPLAAPRTPRWARALVAFTFFTSLGVFGALTLFGPDAHNLVSLQEQRTLALPPARPHDLASLESFPAQCEAWINDHLWLRSWLTEIYGVLEVRLLGHSTRLDVVIGKAGWLFYNGASMDDYRGLARYSEEQLDFMRVYLAARNAWFARRHIAYKFFVVPDKHTVYPEYLPDYLRRKVRPGTRLDQFLEAAALNDAIAPSISILDLRPLLRSAKPRNRLYLRTDTHWNETGARVGIAAVREWMQQASPGRRVPPTSGGLPVVEDGEGGDLARFLSLADVLHERAPHWPTPPTVDSQDWQQAGMEDWQPHARLYVRSDGQADLRAVMFNDSFGEGMEIRLAESCAATLCFSRFDTTHFATFNLMRQLIDGFKPDLVVEEVVERNLPDFFFGDPAIGDETVHYMEDP